MRVRQSFFSPVFFSPVLFYFVLLSVNSWKSENWRCMMRELDNMKAGKTHEELASAFMRATSILAPKWNGFIYFSFKKSSTACGFIALCPMLISPSAVFYTLPLFLDNCPPFSLDETSFQDSINPLHFPKDKLIVNNNKMGKWLLLCKVSFGLFVCFCFHFHILSNSWNNPIGTHYCHSPFTSEKKQAQAPWKY